MHAKTNAATIFACRAIFYACIPANCPYLIGTIPILTKAKSKKKECGFTMCPYFCWNLSMVMYRKFRNVPIFSHFCPYFWNVRVGRYAHVLSSRSDRSRWRWHMHLTHHGYFDYGKTQRPPIWSPCQDKNGTGSGISRVNLLFKCRMR